MSVGLRRVARSGEPATAIGLHHLEDHNRHAVRARGCGPIDCIDLAYDDVADKPVAGTWSRTTVQGDRFCAFSSLRGLMSSRLYRAIVGVGISLGTTVGACSGALENSPDGNDTARKGAILDAFCDATWPTTKGNSGGPTCGPVAACAEAGRAPTCYEALAPSVCNADSPGSAAWCVGDQWACSMASVTYTSCKCWGPLEAGASCP